MLTKRIALIITYFGRFPDYSTLWFKSARFNRRFDLLIFTDQVKTPSRDGNIEFIPMTLDEFGVLASRKLGATFELCAYWKTGDFRPAFGFLFEEYLQGYHFWGHTEMDVIWGDLSRFISDSLLSRYDILTADSEQLAGPFTLYRNLPDVNLLFVRIEDFIRHAQAPKCRHIDELAFDRVIRRSNVRLRPRHFWHWSSGRLENLRTFAGSQRSYQLAVDSFEHVGDGGYRLPALWREGQLRTFLPSAKAGTLRIVDRAFVHLPKGKVCYTIDLRNDLILPVQRTVPVYLPGDWHLDRAVGA